MLTYTGPVRLYFNAKSDAPRVWCIAATSMRWEIEVCSVDFHGAPGVTVYAPNDDARPDHVRVPAGFIEFAECYVAIDDHGDATIRTIEQ